MGLFGLLQSAPGLSAGTFRLKGLENNYNLEPGTERATADRSHIEGCAKRRASVQVCVDTFVRKDDLYEVYEKKNKHICSYRSLEQVFASVGIS